ncbi:MAG: hypothetical protein A2W66_04505 [Deltaproteobacteria bacterium RIFCSPLOWO2_02_56_12]|nr:MAG: hypothetical protein A2W66_04505 [Deltaproteobacteria bacterium RIFCSPLOWO2_02_56_12]
MASEKKIVIIAGPDGAGKTTFAVEFLPREADCPREMRISPIKRLTTRKQPKSPSKSSTTTAMKF